MHLKQGTASLDVSVAGDQFSFVEPNREFEISSGRPISLRVCLGRS